MKVMGLSGLGIASGLLLGSLGPLPFLLSSPTDQATTTPHAAHKIDFGGGPQNRHKESMDRSNDANHSIAVATLRQKIDRLKEGRDFVNRMGDYTATIRKQEVVGNELLDEHTILIKCRQNPFSVYLKWETGDPGREVLFIEGQNNGKMIAHDGGWKARLPALLLTPESWLAMRDARYPITSAGLCGLLDTMRDVHEDDINKSNLASCVVEDGEFEGRPCEVFTTVYQSPAGSPVYRKSVTMIDREWRVPIHSRHYEWPSSGSSLSGGELDKATLIESYSFSEIHFQAGLSDHDFDRTNPDYRFR